MENGVAASTASRAALDAAREVFRSMTTAGDLTGAPAALSGTDLTTPAGRALASWHAAEAILRHVTGRADLGGQALVGEARRLDRLTLGDAHVLVALHGWMERQTSPGAALGHQAAPPPDAERTVAREALLALEHAVATVQRDSARTAGESTADFAVNGARRSPSFAPPGSALPPSAAASYGAPAASYGAPAASAGAAASAAGSATSRDRFASASRDASPPYDAVEPPVRARRSYRSPAFLIGALALLLLVGAGAWSLVNTRAGGAYAEGTEAYSRGAREAASLAFARAATDDPDDPRPLIFLARISREEGDLPRARRFLDRAVRLAPNSAVAQREMASTMLAEGNPELARRFYVRALEIDPTDRLSQGFLACALHRLGRFEDAGRFAQRAGPGEWSPCLSTPAMPAVPNGMIPGAPLPPPGAPPR
jgi:tetratricopeptide (TPR) repeat protein